MKFSIVTPCFNSENTIRNTIESVIYQEGNFEIEYIIIDGKSNDNTYKIVKEYEDKILKQDTFKCNNITFKSISEKDNGMYCALSKGLKICTGDIVAYINSDDKYLNGTFNLIKNIFEKFQVVKWLTSQPLIVNEENYCIDYKKVFGFKKNLIKKGRYGTILDFIMQEGTFWRKELNKKIDYGYLEQCKLAGDYYIWKCFSEYEELFLLNSFCSSFTKRKGQLSEQKEKYISELKNIADKCNIIDFIQAIYYRCIQIVCAGIPFKISVKIAHNIIFYNEIIEEWVIKS